MTPLFVSQVETILSTGTGDALKTPNVLVDEKIPDASSLHPAGTGLSAATSSERISWGYRFAAVTSVSVSGAWLTTVAGAGTVVVLVESDVPPRTTSDFGCCGVTWSCC